jgi:hypothetical protein
MSRCDIHRPSVLIVSDYEFIEFEYLGPDNWQGMDARRATIHAHMERTGGTYSHHAHGGNCHICGARAIYTALFHHRPSNVYIRTGLDCADKLDCGDADSFRVLVRSALEQQAGKRKAETVLTNVGLDAAWRIYADRATGREEGIICDIVERLVRYGSISPAQTAFLHRLCEQIASRSTVAAKREQERSAAAPLPITDARVTVIGTVLSTKTVETPYGTQIKMLVQHRDGWKVFGSIPDSIMSAVENGITVRFDAKIQASRDDTKFGFFNRPTKATIVSL